MSENLFLARMVSAISGAKVELLDSSSQLNQNETVSCEWFHKGCLATPGRMFKVAKDVAFQDAQVCDPYDEAGGSLNINVRCFTGKLLRIECVHEMSSVSSLKKKIYKEEGSLIEIHQRLIFAGLYLEDHRTLSDYGITNESTIHCVLNLRGGGVFQLSAEFRDPRYDYDFSAVVDTAEYWRGERRYFRPCGWKRMALNVLNKYGPDNSWLGTGSGTASSPGEWEVSYHGTKSCSAEKIAEKGYDINRLIRKLYGNGFYSTPNIAVAELYASEFEYDGVRYKAVLQNRVNPATRRIITAEETDVGEYWVTTQQDDIRAYGICYKKCGN